jgi:hypothetical protein
MLESLLAKAKSNRTTREREKLQFEATKNLVSLAKPIFDILQDLADETITAAETSDRRLNDFQTKYPYYPIRHRAAPVFSLLALQLKFLGNHYSDRGLGISEKWEDHGSYSAKKLAGLVVFGGPSGKVENYDEHELMVAHLEYLALNPELLNDVESLLPKLENFSEASHAAQKTLYELITKYKSENIRCPGNLAVPCVGLSEALMSTVLGWPGGPAFIS